MDLEVKPTWDEASGEWLLDKHHSPRRRAVRRPVVGGDQDDDVSGGKRQVKRADPDVKPAPKPRKRKAQKGKKSETFKAPWEEQEVEAGDEGPHQSRRELSSTSTSSCPASETKVGDSSFQSSLEPYPC